MDKALDELLERATSWLERLEELPFDERRLHKLRRTIDYQLARLLER